MRIGSFDNYKNTREQYIGYYLLSIISALMVAFIIAFMFGMAKVLLKFIIKRWIWIIGIILAILIIRRLLLKK